MSLPHQSWEEEDAFGVCEEKTSRARSRCVFSHDPLILWRGGESHANIRMRCSVLYIPHFPTSVHSLRSGDFPTEGDFPQKAWV